MSKEFKNSGISTPSFDTSRSSTQIHIALSNPTSMSESLLKVIVLPSLVYPCFELDIEQDEICVSPVNQARN